MKRWLVWLALAALQILWAMARGIGIVDESWFLQVIARMAAGETLYRDIYFNTTPLSAWVTAAVVAMTGVQLLAVKLVMAFSVLASIVISWKTIERIAPGRPPLLMAALVLVYGNYPSFSPYTPLAVTFFMLTLYGFVVWLENQRTAVLFWSGVAAGLAFASKYNAGLLAVAALALAVVTHRRPVARQLAAIAGGFLAIAGTVIAVIAATGGLQAFIEYAFLNKTTYLAIAPKPYAEGWRMVFEAGSLSDLHVRLIVAVPLIALAVLIRWAFVARSRVMGLAIFLLAGYAITFPRAAVSIWTVIPILATITTIAWRLGGAPRGRTLRVAFLAGATAWLGVALVMMIAGPLERLGDEGWRFSKIAHCRAILIEQKTDEELLATAAELRRAAAGEPTFIQSISAGFHYLASGIRNPTPYDMPALTTFGPHGQQRVIALIESGRIDRVAVIPDPPRFQFQVPRELVAFVETTMVPVAKSERFAVFRTASAARRGTPAPPRPAP